MKTFVLVFYSRPGDVAVCSYSTEVAERNPEVFARVVEKGVVAFSYYDAEGPSTEGKHISRINESATYFIDGEFLDKQGVRALNLPDFFQGNMLYNLEQASPGARVAKTRVEGVSLIAQPNDVLVSSAA